MTFGYNKSIKCVCRERYRDLVNQCQKMHSSIGTGALAYVVGSKVMDMRTSSRGDGRRETEVENAQAFSVDTNKLASNSDRDYNFTNTSNAYQGEIFSDPGDLVSVRRSTDGAACDSFSSLPTPGPYSCSSPILDSEAHGSEYVTGNDFDFPPLPVTDLFEKNSKNKKLFRSHDSRYTRRKLRYGDERMHSFSIKNNADLVIESNVTQSYDSLHSLNSEIEIVCPDVTDSISRSKKVENKMEIYDRIRISDAPETADTNVTTTEGGALSEERVSEWLWTLHRIGKLVTNCLL